MLSAASLRSLSAADVFACRPDCVVSDYPDYAGEGASLSAQETAQVRDLAVDVFDTLSSDTPARAVVVLGYFDLALRVGAWWPADFEKDMSLRRAESGKDVFEAELVRCAGARSILYMLRCVAIGMGSSDPIVVNLRNEADMRKNRRVEFYVLKQSVSRPSCAVEF